MGISVTELFKRFEIEEPEAFGTTLDILIVEPHSEVRLIILQQLQKLGFVKSRAVRDGVAALQELRKQRANFIMLSNELEPPNAFDIMQELREDFRIQRDVVILCTHALNRDNLMYALDKGFDGFLVKPYVLNEILAKLKAAHAAFANTKNPELIFEFAKASMRENQLDKAAEVYGILAEATVKAARPHVGLARVSRMKGALDLAQKHAETAIQRNDQYTYAHLMLGEIHLDRGDFDSASRSFRQALQISPLNLLIYESSVDALVKAQRVDDAISLLNQGISADFQHPFIIKRLGSCYFQKKDYQKAVRYLRQAADLDPENLSTMNALAICLRDAKQFDDALDVYNGIIKKDNENYAVMFNKSLLLNMMGRREDAVKLLKRILLNKPDFQKARDKLKEFGVNVD